MQVKAAVTVILIKVIHTYYDEVYVCVFVCLSRKMTMKNPKKTAKFYLSKNNQSKLSAGGSNCETLRNLKNVPARTVSWAHDPGIVLMIM